MKAKNKILKKLKPLQKHWLTVREHWLTLPKLHRRGLTVASAVLLIALMPWPQGEETVADTSAGEESSMRSLSLPNATPEPAQRQSLIKPIEVAPAPMDVALVRGNWRAYVVVKGDTLSQILRKHGLEASQMTPLLQADSEKLLSRLRPGQLLTLYISRDKQLIELQMKANEEVSWRFVQYDDGSFVLADG